MGNIERGNEMADEHIKALIKEAIEKDRKERIQARIDHFIIGLLGALFFVMFFVIAALFSFGFIGGMILGIGILLDAGIMGMLVSGASDVRKKQFKENKCSSR